MHKPAPNLPAPVFFGFFFMGVIAKNAYRNGFLKSEWWQNFRLEVLVKHKGKCFLCKTEGYGLDVHHVVYPKRWKDTKARNCVALCRKCHTEVHGWFDNENQGWSSFRRYRQLIMLRKGMILKENILVPLNPMVVLAFYGINLFPKLDINPKRKLSWYEVHILKLNEDENYAIDSFPNYLTSV